MKPIFCPPAAHRQQRGRTFLPHHRTRGCSTIPYITTVGAFVVVKQETKAGEGGGDEMAGKRFLVAPDDGRGFVGNKEAPDLHEAEG